MSLKLQKLTHLHYPFAQKPGLYLVATAKAVILYNNGQVMSINPNMADDLAKSLPRYAALSRSLAK